MSAEFDRNIILEGINASATVSYKHGYQQALADFEALLDEDHELHNKLTQLRNQIEKMGTRK